MIVVGHLAALEWDTKAAHVVAPNLAAGHEVGVFLALLEQGRATTPAAPFAGLSEPQLRGHMERSLPHGAHLSILFHDPKAIASFPRDPTWEALLQDGAEAQAAQQRQLMLCWALLRQAMLMLDQAELAAGSLYDLVLRLDDATVVPAPWAVPTGWATQGLTHITCLSAPAFAVGREWAWEIVEGLGADWFLAHSHFERSQKRPTGPESWLGLLAEFHEVPTQTSSACNLPPPAPAARSPAVTTHHRDGLSIAVLVVGQLARLEWESKAAHVVAPNLKASREVGVFFALSRGVGQYVNILSTKDRRMRLVDGPYARHSARQLEKEVHDSVGSSRAALTVRVKLVDDHGATFISDPQWAKALDKPKGTAFNLKRQGLHLLQWSHFRLAMLEMDKAEVARGSQYGAVLRIRDDALALMPWAPDPAQAAAGIATLRCLQWDGLMDGSSLLGRRWAWGVYEGAAADWYLSHARFKVMHNCNTGPQTSSRKCRAPDTVPKNPEGWLRRMAALYNVPSHECSLCDLPFLSTRYVDEDGKRHLVGKMRHLDAFKGGGSCRKGCSEPDEARILRELKKLKACPADICRSR